MMGKLTEKSKEFDELTIKYDSMRATYSVRESRAREEIYNSQKRNMQLRVQIERSNDEAVKVAKMQQERGVLVSLQKTTIDNLERVAVSGDFKHD